MIADHGREIQIRQPRSTGPVAMPVEITPVEMLARLVAFDTTSNKSNLALIDWVASYLAGYGIASRLTYDEGRAKANLYATIGPEVAGGVVLSGHTDVVPTAGQNWTSNPFALVERDGRLHGRGTADMKGFIATALALLPGMARRHLKTPIHLALSFDEEVGCFGVVHIIREIEQALPRPRLVIVGEPTEMKVANAHKGVVAVHTRVVGREGHSSGTHRGANAITAAAELIRFLADLAAEFARRPPRPGSADGEFDPPYTTINVGTIEGGTALNIIAKACFFRWECRPLPGARDGDEILARFNEFANERVSPRLKAASPEGGVFTSVSVAVPALMPEPGSPAEALALALSGENRAGAVAYGSEAGLFQSAGIPAALCGPGSVRQAHQPDEFVARAQLEACEAFVRRLVERCTV